MTDWEKAVVMAYTGTTMLTGDKLQVFRDYIEKICGRPIWTHELSNDAVADEIKEKSKDDFLAICMSQDVLDIDRMKVNRRTYLEADKVLRVLNKLIAEAAALRDHPDFAWQHRSYSFAYAYLTAARGMINDLMRRDA